MPNYLEVMTPAPMQSVASSTMTGSYVTLATLIAQARLFKIVNNSTQDVTISYNGGTTDHDYVPAGGFTLYDGTANAVSNAKFNLPNATVVKVKGTAGTGNIYFIYFFGS
jgi:hypothetical protein